MYLGGGRNLGVQVLEWLCGQKEYEVAAVCPIPEELDADAHGAIMDIADRYKLKVCDISQIRQLEADIGLSVNYHRIIGEDILRHCRKGFYNVHHSYNLRLRGRNITTHAILNTLTENVYYHGTTLHKMIPRLDAGPIAASRSVDIAFDDTAGSLFQKVDDAALHMIKEWLPRLVFQKVFLYDPPKEGIHSYKNADLPDRMLDVNRMTAAEIDAYIRAFDFPGKEPAFFRAPEGKVHLVYRARDRYKYEFEIKGDTYYTDVG